jgi:hypothetical protein
VQRQLHLKLHVVVDLAAKHAHEFEPLQVNHEQLRRHVDLQHLLGANLRT